MNTVTFWLVPTTVWQYLYFTHFSLATPQTVSKPFSLVLSVSPVSVCITSLLGMVCHQFPSFFFLLNCPFFPQTNHKKVTLYAARWSGQIKKPEKRVNKSWTILNMYHIIQLVTRHIYLVMKQILATLNYLCNICGVIFLAYLQGISLTFLTVLLASVRRYQNIVDFFLTYHGHLSTLICDFHN